MSEQFDILRSICADCTEEQRMKCQKSDKGCDEFYKWRSDHVSKILNALDTLNGAITTDSTKSELVKEYYSKRASILIGNSECQTAFSNGCGYGCFSVHVIEEKEISNCYYNLTDEDWKYVGSVHGDNINVYKYDYIKDFTKAENILFCLSGNFQVFNKNGDIILYKFK